MSDSNRPDELVTLTRFGELLPAQLLRGRLDTEGIECLIPDETMANQTWHLTGAIGGIRVQVRRADLERAKQILAEPGIPPGDDGASEAGGEAAVHKRNGVSDDGSISLGDRAAFRALRVALVSLWLMGIIHPYSLWLSVRALRRHDVTSWGRRRAWIALVVSSMGCAWAAFLVYRFARL